AHGARRPMGPTPDEPDGPWNPTPWTRRLMEPSLTEELRPLCAGRRVVVPGGPFGGLTWVCLGVRELGAERPFLLATGMGTGEVPHPEEAEWCVVEVRAPDGVAQIRAAMRLLRA